MHKECLTWFCSNASVKGSVVNPDISSIAPRDTENLRNAEDTGPVVTIGETTCSKISMVMPGINIETSLHTNLALILSLKSRLSQYCC